MGYRIEYGFSSKFEDRQDSSTGKRILMTLALLILFLTFVKRYWPEGARVLETLAHSLRWEFGHNAMEILAQDLRSGMPFYEAVTAFCREIVAYGLEYAA